MYRLIVLYIMANAKEEFLKHVNGKDLKCVFIEYNADFYGDGKKYFLPVNFTDEEYNSFINSIDFNYNNGYGLQELYGAIWYKDGTWSDRHEYDGSECWDYQKCPQIPILLRLNSFK